MNKDESLIPQGLYCYSIVDGERVQCPYYGKDKENDLYQENGYCGFLEKGDWQLNEESGMLKGWRSDGKPVPPVSAHEIKASLLWDECKECGINEEEV